MPMVARCGLTCRSREMGCGGIQLFWCDLDGEFSAADEKTSLRGQSTRCVINCLRAADAQVG